MHTREEAEALLGADVRGSDLVLGGNHAFCTTRMHGDPEQGVVDEWGRCHDLENLWIADTGVFPRCPSVNPMWTLMALARRSAGQLAEQI
jgi:choline dehydrogenase-like flavoprotein